MLESKPFIHLFKTPGGSYIYDVNTNIIAKIKNEVYDFLQSGGFEQGVSHPEVLGTIKHMESQGLLSKKIYSHIAHPGEDFLEDYTSNKLRMITLQITQRCNLRCKYCTYSGIYKNRTHSEMNMDILTAQKSIDFLISNSRDTEQISIGFYGGEPLMEFELLKKCVEYAEEKGEGKDIYFTITTNATLLTDEIIEYFIDHGVVLLISLDGPRHVHDKNRKFAYGKGGSFDKVMENLETIRQKYPEYFKTVTFNAVLDMENDFSCINEFFVGYETIKDSIMRTSFISNLYMNNDNDIRVEEDFLIKKNYETFKVLLSKLGRLDEGHISKVVQQEYSDIKLYMYDYRKPVKDLADTGCPSGPCIPGVTRLFIDVKGNFFPCERVSETSEVMKIGHVDTGFDMGKIRSLLNVSKLTEECCKRCWAFKFCYLCANSADDITQLSAEKRLSQCAGVRGSREGMMKDYCVLKEFGYDFDKYNQMVDFI